jgi:hypothetical protein
MPCFSRFNSAVWANQHSSHLLGQSARWSGHCVSLHLIAGHCITILRASFAFYISMRIALAALGQHSPSSPRSPRSRSIQVLYRATAFTSRFDASSNLQTDEKANIQLQGPHHPGLMPRGRLIPLPQLRLLHGLRGAFSISTWRRFLLNPEIRTPSHT